MRYLLDTHAFLWWSDDYSNLSSKVYAICQDAENELLLSIACVWEIQIKAQLGKLKLPETLEKIISTQHRTNRLNLLAIQTQHIYGLGKLPNHHQDPFDRMMISQALYESIPIITKDEKIAKYPVEVIW